MIGGTARRYAGLAIALVLVMHPVIAKPTDTPECRAALDDANRLMRSVQERQMQFNRHDPAANCRLLRDDLDDLISAREPIDRCLTGDERAKNLGQIDAAIEQIRAQLIGNCVR